MVLRGRTPDEVYHRKRAANTLPRTEPRVGLKHSSPCAAPRVMMAGKAGRNVTVYFLFFRKLVLRENRRIAIFPLP